MIGGLATLALVVVAILVAPRAAASPALRPFRSLLPSWRFFDAIEETPLMYLRAAAGDGGWRPLVPPPVRRPWSGLFNPHGNLLLAAHGALDQLVDELEEAGPLTPEEAEGLSSYELVQRLAVHLHPGLGPYQLRLVMVRVGEGGAAREEEVFVSRVHAP